jgi:hypothetical protein
MVAGCELWRKTRRAPPPAEDDGLEWARRKMGITRPPVQSPPGPSIAVMSPMLSGATVMPDDQNPPVSAHNQEEETESVVKIRIDQSWNVRVLWEGRVKDLLVSAGVGLGPGSFSVLPSTPPSPSYAAGGQSAGGGAPGVSYWRGVGVSILYSS